MACGTFGESIGGPASYVIVAGGKGYVTPTTMGALNRVEVLVLQTGTWQEGSIYRAPLIGGPQVA